MPTLNFALILLFAVIITGMIALFSWVFHWRNGLVNLCRSLFPLLLLIWILRSFIVQPYVVPTGSMEPSIIPGDFIAVTQYNYGLRFPVWPVLLVKTGEPKRGDIALFRAPHKKNMTYVKRVIGLPGDHIQYIKRVLYINGTRCSQTYMKSTMDIEPQHWRRRVNEYQENLLGVKHAIYLTIAGKRQRFADFDYIVPAGHYFMMGDNRDNSSDSRVFGAVAASHLIGRADVIWLSYNAKDKRVRFSRIGRISHAGS